MSEPKEKERDDDINEITEDLFEMSAEGRIDPNDIEFAKVSLLALAVKELRDLKWMFDSFERHYRVHHM